MFEITGKGDFSKTKNFLTKMIRKDEFSALEQYGQMGVTALQRSTPVDTGLARESWGYKIVRGPRTTSIEWYNTDIEGGSKVVILIQYGHATGTGGYVQGRDFINPAMRPVFDRIANDMWEKVKSG